MLWPRRSPPIKALQAGDVHIWSVDLQPSPDLLNRSDSFLAPEETAQAARFHQAVHRDRYRIAHGVLREILAAYSGQRPPDLEIVAAADGKPELARSGETQPLFFNLAHSDDLALVAVTTIGEVGVDLERLNDVPDADDIASRFFSDREARELATLTGTDKSKAFLRCWTRKEAYVKATGAGLRCPLRDFDVEMNADAPPRFLQINGDTDAAARWTLGHLEPTDTFVGAFAIQSSEVRTSCFHWVPPHGN